MASLDQTLNNAKSEAERLAEQMKKSAEQIHKGKRGRDAEQNRRSKVAEVRERMSNPDPYTRVVHQLRTAQLVALGIEVTNRLHQPNELLSCL